MSYPPGPQNPYGQNPYAGQNPYGQQQPQPGYGYPQQAQQPQQAYGYPQAPPASPYGMQPGGIPGGAPGAMPGKVRSARTMLFVISGFAVLGAIVMFIATAFMSSSMQDSGVYDDAETSTYAGMTTGVFIGMGVLALLFAGLGVFLATQFTKGGNGIRVTAIVYASLAALTFLLNFIYVVTLGGVVLAIMVIVNLSKPESAAWFNRPRT